jgi:hypothetical protein
VAKVYIALKNELFRDVGEFDAWVKANKRFQYAIDPNIRQIWPNLEEYQLWRRSDPREAANGLLELLKKRFGTGADFEDWLKEKDIDSDFSRAIGG